MAAMINLCENRLATALFSLAATILLALTNPASAGAVCNQVCADGTSNTFFGVNTGASATGTINTGFGVGALSGMLTGGSNTAIGDDTLASDTTGSNNTAAGTFALID